MNDLTGWILKISVVTLSLVVIGVVTTLMVALFEPSVENDKIFEIVGPAFNTVVGAFVGLLGGISLSRSNKD